MNLHKIRLPLPVPANEEGQSIVIVALFLFFVFLAFAALSIDGTIIYMHRRQLQNIADAAALAAAIELNQLKTEAEAYQAAMDSIAANEGQIEWYSDNPSPDPPNTNAGSGQGLQMGIEITGSCDVRVALLWSDVGTYFAQFVGRGRLQVGANARAGCNMTGGLQPIAVKRFGDQFDWDTNPGLNSNNATVYCRPDCNTREELATQGKGNANDFLRPAVSDTDTITIWPGWPGNNALLYQSPSPHADLAGGAPGREYYILGGGVGPNMGNNSYAGLVNLDIRNLSPGPVEYYNGVTAGTNSNTLKDLGETYIRRGYCCDIPKPGDQVAIYNGNNTSFAAQAFQETYAVGDVVAVIVYNGIVYKNPELNLSGQADNNPSENYNDPFTYPTTTTLASHAVTYTINLQASPEFGSANPGGITLQVEGLSGFADWEFLPDNPVLGYGGIDEIDVSLVVTPTVTTVGTTTHVITGTRMFYVVAHDNKFGGTNIKRYWPGIITVGDEISGTQRLLPSVTAYPDLVQFYVKKGDPATGIRLSLDLWGVSSNQTVTVTPGSLPTGFQWGNPGPPWTYTFDDHKEFNIKLQVDNTAVAQPDPYVVPLTVSAPGMASQTFNLYVIVEEAVNNPEDYVEILGYAALEVTEYPSVNSVRARIISQMWDHPSKMTYGLRARLIPWDQ